MQHIEVELKNKYGTDYIYPADDKAQKFCRLLGGQKTLTQRNIEDIKALGFEVRVKQHAKAVL